MIVLCVGGTKPRLGYQNAPLVDIKCCDPNGNNDEFVSNTSNNAQAVSSFLLPSCRNFLDPQSDFQSVNMVEQSVPETRVLAIASHVRR